MTPLKRNPSRRGGRSIFHSGKKTPLQIICWFSFFKGPLLNLHGNGFLLVFVPWTSGVANALQAKFVGRFLATTTFGALTFGLVCGQLGVMLALGPLAPGRFVFSPPCFVSFSFFLFCCCVFFRAGWLPPVEVLPFESSLLQS